MIGLDTNVLLRFILADDPLQSPKVRDLLQRTRKSSELAFIPHVVLCEAEWVLRAVYRKTKTEILYYFRELLDSDVLLIQEDDVVTRALDSWESGPADFTDYLIGHANLANGCRVTITFDQALRQSTAFFEM